MEEVKENILFLNFCFCYKITPDSYTKVCVMHKFQTTYLVAPKVGYMDEFLPTCPHSERNVFLKIFL